MGMRAGAVLLSAVFTGHAGGSQIVGEIPQIDLSSWSWPPSIAIPLFATGLIYCLGFLRMRRHASRGVVPKPVPTMAFAAGWLALLLALDSPVHELSEQLFWVHMTQHEILVLIAAPLMVLSNAGNIFLWAMPRSWRASAGALFGNSRSGEIWSALTKPAVAWAIHAVALWGWHAPVLFNATLRSDAIHALQHSSFFFTALLFWWALVHRQHGTNYGAAILYVFTTAVHTSALGALLTFASSAWYAPYFETTLAWHLTPLEDQQLGGLIMWVPAGTLLTVIGLLMIPKWLRTSQRRWELSRSADLLQARRSAR